MNKFIIDANDTVIWNRDDLIKFLVVNQDRWIVLEVREGPCLENLGLYKILDHFSFKDVTISTHNAVEESPTDKYRIRIVTDAVYQYVTFPADSDYTPLHHWNGKHVFGALYNRATWSRIGLAGHLNKHHKDKTSLNFRYDPHNEDMRTTFEIEPIFKMHPQSFKDFMERLDDFPALLEETSTYRIGQGTKTFTDQLGQYYPDFLIDVVSETFTLGRTFSPTEKAIRPMLLKKPFIMMASQNFLIYLRQMGFETFHEFWPEDYDG